MSEAKRDVVIRPEQPKDFAAVRDLNLAAFPSPAEANLVDELRANAKAALSLVAVQDNRIVGHILFSPVTVESNNGEYPVLGLAPMAVLPKFQRKGVGSLLVTAGLAHCKRAGVRGRPRCRSLLMAPITLRRLGAHVGEYPAGQLE